MAEEEEDTGGEERPSMAQFSALTTYSDLITLMASFFLLMFMIALQEQNKAKATMETVMDAIARQLGSYPSGGSLAPRAAADRRGAGKAGEDMKHGPPGKRSEVMALDEGERQKLAKGDEILFGPGSSTLSAKAKHSLQADIVPDMKGFNSRISIQGYTAGAEDENQVNLWELSYARAFAVMNFLVSECDMDEKRFQLTGFADTKPHAGQPPPANRRVEIVMGEVLDENPGHERKDTVETGR